MRITIFSSNQPRHLNLVKEFAQIADEVYFISEANTIFPGKLSDFFQKSDLMQQYFNKVISAEKKIFGDVSFLPTNVKVISIKFGDLNYLDKEHLSEALSSDIYVVFGSSYIKGWLIDFLIEKRAVNIHMGLSPYYRGSSCNFWALYDKNYNHVGATIHLLSRGLDSGDILFHCVPRIKTHDNLFDYTMRSSLVAQKALRNKVEKKSLLSLKSVKQDKSLEIKYTINQNFNDEVVKEFLERDEIIEYTPDYYPKLIRPVFG